jgi:hypothetical protein
MARRTDITWSLRIVSALNLMKATRRARQKTPRLRSP